MNRASVDPNHCSLSVQQQIDEIAERFERDWIDGKRGDLDRYVRISPPGLRVPLFRELLLIDLVYRRRLGEKPGLEEYARRFPHHAAIVADIFEPEPSERTDHDIVADRYRIEEVIGQGAFGIVYRATDLDLARTVALKLRRDTDNAAVKRSREWIEEARMAAKLEHPGIVSVFDAGTLDDGTSYLVFQYIAGRTLRAYADEELPVDWTQLFAAIADALAYAHRQRCVHRDLKPENILIDTEGTPKIVDFGLAIHEDDRPGRRGEVAGSPIYMAPEQVRGEADRLDGRCDIWAMGVMLYECLVGELPFRSDDADRLAEEILNRIPKPLRQVDTSIPRRLETAVLRCLAKNPAERFATADDLASELRQCGQQASRRQWLAVAGIGGLAACGLGAYARWNGLPWRNNGERNRSARRSRIDLLLWRDDNWISAREPGVRCLRDGDQVRLRLSLDSTAADSAAVPYIVWIDSQGAIVPVHPFHDGGWEESRSPDRIKSLELPNGSADDVWTVNGKQEGAEAIVMGVGQSPQTDIESLRKLPRLDGRFPLERLPEPWWFYNGRFQYSTSRPDRGVDPAQVSRLDHPILEWQLALYEQLRGQFEEVVSVVFPLRS
jgi:tRNA A-37 threonylcarbamoyl transferase component Bud32